MATKVPKAPNKVLRLLSSDTTSPIDPLLQQRQVIGIYDALDALAQSAFSVVNNVNTFTGSPLAYTTVMANATAVTQERNLNFSSAFSVVDNAPQARTDVALATTGVTPSSYGDSTHVGAFAVDATGRITAANSVAISFPSAGITQLTGDVTAGPGSGSVVATIQTNVVTNAKLAQMPAITFKGNAVGGTANAADLTPTQATSMLNLFSSSLQGLAPASGGGSANFLHADGTWNTTVPNLWTLTPGAIAFIDSTTHKVDNDPNNLFWDNTNKRAILGLGGAYTPAAGAPLSIWSSSGNIAIELDQAATQGIAKYNGSFPIGTGDANSMALLTNATHRLDLTATGGAKASSEPVSGGETAWKWDLSGASHTNVSAEVPDILANMSRLVTLTSGTIASMRAFRIDPVTYAGTGSSVITDAATLGINGPPSTGAGATITNKWTLWSQGGAAKFDAASGGTSAVFSDGGVNSTLKISHGATNRVVLDAAANVLALRAGGTDMLTVNGASFIVAMPVLAPGSQQSLLISSATGQLQAGLVTNAMLATMGAFTFKGNNTGATAGPVDMTSAQAVSILPVFSSSANGTVPNPGSSSTTKFLRADGTWAIPGSLKSVQSFTTATGGTAYSVPAGVTSVLVEIWGGGGGSSGVGAGGVGQCTVGTAGGQGAYTKRFYAAIGNTNTIVVGAGGAGGAAGANAGSNGNGSSFSDGTTAIIVTGGRGGPTPAGSASTANITPGGDGGSVSTAGDVSQPGLPGGAAIRFANTGVTGDGLAGVGGGTGFSAGVTVTSGVTSPGIQGSIGGGGAGGPTSGSGAAAIAGNTGGVGRVVIWEFA
jgi:hypothetical protein